MRPSTVALFKKESINLVKRSNTLNKEVRPFKWKPTDGNSFRSFAEYRLKVVNQSPLNKTMYNKKKDI